MGLFDAIRDLLNGDASGESGSGSGSGSGGGAGRGVIEDRSRFGEPDHVPPGCLVGDSVEDLREMAEDYAGTWEEFGPTDYSLESIPGIDEMFATQQERANWLTIDLEDGRTGAFAPMAAQPACYFGEVLVRNYDAQWVLDEDYGWALQFKGGVIVNLFGTVHRALEADPPFLQMHDTFVENYDLDGAPLDPDGERLAERRAPGDVDPDRIDEAEVEQAAEESHQTGEDMRSFAADFVDNHPGYDLDYSVESLSAADEVLAEKFRTERFADAELGGTDTEASILLTAATTEVGAYFGEVLRRNTAAEWRHREDDGLKLEVPRETGEIRIEPMGAAHSAVTDGDSLAERYDEYVEAIGTISDELDGA